MLSQRETTGVMRPNRLAIGNGERLCFGHDIES
jgi:hypothetical protein